MSLECMHLQPSDARVYYDVSLESLTCMLSNSSDGFMCLMLHVFSTIAHKIDVHVRA